ncbi:hypothetical protein [Jeotgalibacillus soli]|uniref:Uncharacterized protein n=1 Tax=Jeotgalibacillus soli TaxID=889306 RepID=A0A0C2RVE4_9BACL|nr:hypothetical protein [Jeotgalibacillus soli]KIL45729.1 hypothetical protein KP78_20780 [Jeotgalibacillus soli]
MDSVVHDSVKFLGKHGVKSEIEFHRYTGLYILNIYEDNNGECLKEAITETVFTKEDLVEFASEILRFVEKSEGTID